MEVENEPNKELEQAIKHYNAIAEVNKVISNYHSKTAKAKILVNNFDKETKFSGALIYSAPLNIVLKSAGSETNLIYDLKLDKMEIRYFLNKNRESELYGFRLGLTLLSSRNEHYLKSIMNSFTIAASGDSNIYWIVCEKSKLKIRDGASHHVRFSAGEDLDKVIDLCNWVITEFNEKLGKDKLLPQMDMR